MGVFEQFPYTNFHDLNLDWILKTLVDQNKTLAEFVASSTLTYAEPLQWNITSQYTKNTVVVGLDGTAYMSIQAVPAGIEITDTNYWQPIFKFSGYIQDLEAQIASNEGSNTNSSRAYTAGTLIFNNDKLYRATQDIPAGRQLLPGDNLEAITVEAAILDQKTVGAASRSAESISDTATESATRTAANIIDSVTGDYTIGASHVSISSERYTEHSTEAREIDADGTNSVHIDGTNTINIGGAHREVYGSSYGKTISGASAEVFDDQASETFNGKHVVTGKDETETFTGNKTITADSIMLDPAQPLQYGEPEKFNDYFNTVKMTSRAGVAYNLLVPGDDFNELGRNTAYVNVKDFGAVGDCGYLDIATFIFYTDSTESKTPTDDTAAINAAIAYADANNIDTIYFPDGGYYLPNWSYDLDISKHQFVGTGNSQLCSSGLTDGAFITLSSPLDLQMYDNARAPLVNIAFWGAYDPMGSGTVAGIRYNVAENLVACHAAFYNIAIKNFNIGLDCQQAYKTTWFNLAAIACGIGININAAAAIPLYFIGGFIECCYYGVQALGAQWEMVSFYSFAFEYNRTHIAISTPMLFYGCRFEGDPTSGDNYMFNLGITSGRIMFEQCDFLFLKNYADNVRHWINNPTQYVKSGDMTYGLFYIPSGDVYFETCRFGIADAITFASGFYLITAVTNSVGAFNSTWYNAGSNLIATEYYKAQTNTLS